MNSQRWFQIRKGTPDLQSARESSRGSKESIPVELVSLVPVPAWRVPLGQPIPACGIQLQGERHPGQPVRVPDEHRVDQSRAHWFRLVREWLPKEQNWFRPGRGQGHFAKQSACGEENKRLFAGL